MLEVRCNGKIYLFPWDSGIVNDLDMRASEVKDDDAPSGGQVIYTHDEAARIVEKFEDLLDKKNIRIPCADTDEESERTPDNAARLYGSEYSGLLDGVERALIDVMDWANVRNYVPDRFSGSF